MIAGLERLYNAHEWDPRYTGLEPDPCGAGHFFNGAFGGAMEIAAAESLYAAVKDVVVEARTAGRRATIAECGTCDGFSTAFMARAIRDAVGPGHVWTAELAEARDGAKPFKWPRVWNELGLGSYITGITGDTRDPATWQRAGMPPAVDLVLIDSEHSFATVVAEWAVFKPWMRPGGRIVMHDCNIPDVAKAAQLIAGDCYSSIEKLPSARELWMLRTPGG